MSRLIFKGDTTSSTGEYLPAPYIEKIYLEEEGYRVEVSVFVPNDDKYITETDGIAEEDDTKIEENLGVLYYYVAVIQNWPTDETDPVAKVIGNEEDLITYYIDNSDSFNETLRFLGPIYKLDPFGNTPTVIYDESGQEFLKYTDTNSVEYEDEDHWMGLRDLVVFAFSTTVDFADDDGTINISSDIEDNEPLLSALTSDIAYEIVWKDNYIADRYQTEYIDAEGAIYDQTPLQGINSIYYKINKITHVGVVEYFEDLIEEMNTEYDTDDHPKLKTALDNISTVLETFAYKVDLVPQLNLLRKNYTDKTPASPIGKLYKRFRNRVYTVNKLLKDSERLRRKVFYNGKIIDLRVVDIDYSLDPSYNEMNDCELVYEDWAATRSRYWDYTGYDEGDAETDSWENWVGSIVNGYFFFDYEKALHKNSEVSKVLDVGKLETLYGSPIPYELFMVDYVTANRTYFGGWWYENASIINWMYTDQVFNFPLTYNNGIYDLRGDGWTSSIVEDPTEPNEDKAQGQWDKILGCTIYGAEGQQGEGAWSHLVVRNVIDVAAEEWTSRENYRLMGFNLMDIQDASSSAYTSRAEEYTIDVVVQDTTAIILYWIWHTIWDASEALGEYLELCEQACAVNEDLGIFNSFFSEAMMAEYEDNPAEAPWIYYPVFFERLRDIMFNFYDGDTEAIIEAALQLTNTINPVNGTIEAIEGLKAALDEIKTTFLTLETDDGETLNDLVDALDIDWSIDSTLPHDLSGEATSYAPKIYSCAIPMPEEIETDSMYIGPAGPIWTSDCGELFTEPPECIDDDDCDDGVCVEGLCVECGDDDDCEEGYECNNGECEPEPVWDWVEIAKGTERMGLFGLDFTDKESIEKIFRDDFGWVTGATMWDYLSGLGSMGIGTLLALLEDARAAEGEYWNDVKDRLEDLHDDWKDNDKETTWSGYYTDFEIERTVDPTIEGANNFVGKFAYRLELEDDKDIKVHYYAYLPDTVDVEWDGMTTDFMQAMISAWEVSVYDSLYIDWDYLIEKWMPY